jgi:hypothetical protein
MWVEGSGNVLRFGVAISNSSKPDGLEGAGILGVEGIEIGDEAKLIP